MIMPMTMTLMMVNSLRKVPRVVVKSRVKGRTVRKVMTMRRKRRQMRLGRKVQTQIMKMERYERDTCN